MNVCERMNVWPISLERPVSVHVRCWFQAHICRVVSSSWTGSKFLWVDRHLWLFPPYIVLPEEIVLTPSIRKSTIQPDIVWFHISYSQKLHAKLKQIVNPVYHCSLYMMSWWSGFYHPGTTHGYLCTSPSIYVLRCFSVCSFLLHIPWKNCSLFWTWKKKKTAIESVSDRQ